MQSEIRCEWMDKTEWGDGPWVGEPDKVQWIDETTGYDCLAVRNHGGAWCGYVGLPPGHPLHGVEYLQPTDSLRDLLARRMGEPVDNSTSMMTVLSMMADMDLKPTPEACLRVHGGLTFSGACDEPTREEYRRAVDLEGLGGVDDLGGAGFEVWAEQQAQRRICHVPRDGRPEDFWWLGFDCSHAGDLSPNLRLEMADILGEAWESSRFSTCEEYRTLDYVRDQVASLAAQLRELEA